MPLVSSMDFWLFNWGQPSVPPAPIKAKGLNITGKVISSEGLIGVASTRNTTGTVISDNIQGVAT